MGLEPTLPGSTDQCFNQLSYEHHIRLLKNCIFPGLASAGTYQKSLRGCHHVGNNHFFFLAIITSVTMFVVHSTVSGNEPFDQSHSYRCMFCH